MKPSEYYQHKATMPFLAPYGVIRVAHGTMLDLYCESKDIVSPLNAPRMPLESAPWHVAEMAEKIGIFADVNQHGEIWLTTNESDDAPTVYIDGRLYDADGLDSKIRLAVTSLLTGEEEYSEEDSYHVRNR